MKARTLLLLVPAAALILLFGGCASSSGALFESAATASPSPAEETEEEELPLEAETGLEIRTSPSRARIEIDGRYYGTSPLLLDLPSGNYTIFAEKSGYYPGSASVSYTEGEYLEVYIDLDEITGFLLADVEPAGAEVRSGFRTIRPGEPAELRIGTYQVEVSAFGYETVRRTVTVEEDETTLLQLVLEEAPFRIDYFSVARERFDPADPGRYGETAASVSVSGPGSGTFTVTGPGGGAVAGPREILFTERWSRIAWDGRDERGDILPEGNYLLRLSAAGEDGAMEERGAVAIDRTIDLRARPVYGGVSGALFCPLPGSLPAGSVQGGLIALAHAEGALYMLPAAASIRFAPADREEIVVSGGIIARGPGGEEGAGDSIPFGSLSWSLPVFSAPHLSGSLVLKGAWFHRSVIDPMASFTGISAAFPAALRAGPLSLAVSPELAAGPDRVTYGEAERESDIPLSAWGYLKTALVADAGPVSLAVSASLRSAPFDTGLSADWPLASGCDLSWLLPGKIITLTAGAALEWDPDLGWYLSGGGGIWFLP